MAVDHRTRVTRRSCTYVGEAKHLPTKESPPVATSSFPVICPRPFHEPYNERSSGRAPYRRSSARAAVPFDEQLPPATSPSAATASATASCLCLHRCRRARRSSWPTPPPTPQLPISRTNSGRDLPSAHRRAAITLRGTVPAIHESPDAEQSLPGLAEAARSVRFSFHAARNRSVRLPTVTGHCYRSRTLYE